MVKIWILTHWFAINKLIIVTRVTEMRTYPGLTPIGNPFIFQMKTILMVHNKEELRKKVEETRWKEMVRDAISLREKSHQETLKMMFELCEFTQKIGRAVNEKL